MEGASQNEIDLDAGLDIHSSDMLVPVTQATFQHNWQRHQGKFLPNSLRFEMNGWAADWNVFNFEYTGTRIKCGNLWLSKTLINNGPVYAINAYETDKSTKVLAVYIMIPDSKLLTNNVAFNNNVISGKVNNKQFNLTWNPESQTFNIDNQDISIQETQLSDKSTQLLISDNTTIFTVDNKLYFPSKLTGTGLSKAVPYIEYDGIRHTWDEFKFDGSKIITPEGLEVTDFTVVDNQLTFNYDSLRQHNLTINYTYSTYVYSFDDLVVTDVVGEEVHVYTDVSKKLSFNKPKVTFNKNNIIAGDTNKTVINCKVPVWLTAVLKPDISYSKGAKWPNNVEGRFIRIKTGARFNKYTVISVFDNVEHITESGSSNDYVHLDMSYRYAAINTANTIEPVSGFNTNRYVPNSSMQCFSTARFSLYNFSLGIIESTIAKYMSDIYEVKSGKCDCRTFFENNNWADWTNETNPVYTAKDISEYASIKLKGQPNEIVIRNDLTFAEENAPTDELLCDNYVVKLLNTPTRIYNLSDTPYDWNDIRIDSFRPTYTRVSKILSSDEYFWPFEYVPMFNYKDRSGNVHTEVYWVTSNEKIITDFDEFRTIVLGKYNSNKALNNNLLLSYTKYNITRVVKNYDTAFDYDFQKEPESFNERWSVWYPSIQNPDRFFSKQANPDTTYFDYNNIDLRREQSPTFSKANPGILLDYSWGSWKYSLDACNKQGVILWQEVSTSATFNIYYNHQEVTDRYDTKLESSDGFITYVQTNSSSAAYKATIFLPGFFGGIDTNVSIAAISSKVLQTYTANAYSGRIHMVAEIKPEYKKSAWMDKIIMSQASGSLQDYIEHWSKGDDEHEPELISIEKCVVSNGMEVATERYLTEGAMDGAVLSQAFYGNAALQVEYTKISSVEELLDPSNRIVYSKAEDILLDSNKLYIDRDTLDKSFNWFDIQVTAIDAVGSGTSGFMLTSLLPKNKAVVYYAKAKIDSEGNEIIFYAYYPNVSGLFNGHMLSATESICQMKINWTLNTVTIPQSVSFELKKYDKINHTVYDILDTLFSSIEYSLPDVKDIVDNIIPISIKLGSSNNSIVLDFNTKTFTTRLRSLNFDLNNASISFDEGTYANKLFTVPFKVICHFTSMSALFALSTSDRLLNWSDSKFTCEHISGNRYIFNVDKQQLNLDTEPVIELFEKYIHIQFDSSVYLKTNALLSNCTDLFKFKYKGLDYQIEKDKLLSTDNIVNVYSTDVRNPDKTDIIGKLNQDSEFQLIKQDWNADVEVENFWWVDSNHILKLTTSEFVLVSKTDELDDWNGDRFNIVDKIPRTDILSTDSLRYEVVNTYKYEGNALLLVYSVFDTDTIEIVIRNPLNNLSIVDKIYLQLVHKNIGSQLNDGIQSGKFAKLNTYSLITAGQLLSQAKWSNTVTDNRLFIGSHLSNNFDQWTAIFNLETFNCERCIQGYGFVSLHGDLTGGMIPKDFFDSRFGFNNTVKDLSVLDKKDYAVKDINEINNIDAKVVGTAEKQWYIKKIVQGIVSHLTYAKNGNFEIKVIPLTNKYDAVYKSPSFTAATYGDLMVQMFSLGSLFEFPSGTDTAWRLITAAVGNPGIFMFNPRCATIGYLQQTFGQYAYVHYNSSESQPEQNTENSRTTDAESAGLGNGVNSKSVAPVLSDELTFDKQIVEQFCNNTPVRRLAFYEVLIGTTLSELAHIDRQMFINGELNQTSMSDVGKQFSQNVMENVGSLGVAALMTESHQTQALYSKVVGIKSLDMFYSTSDKQRIFAGPGFVEHQFTADCVAQSVTNVNVDGKTQQLTFVIKALTTIQGKVTQSAQLAIADGLSAIADKTKEMTIACGVNIGAAIAVATQTGANSIRSLAKASMLLYEALDSMVDTLAQQNVKCSTVNSITRLSTSTEGKHKYGEKCETFMWPCFGVPSSGIDFADETINADIIESKWKLGLSAAVYYTLKEYLGLTSTRTYYEEPKFATHMSDADRKVSDNPRYNLRGDVEYYQASCHGEITVRKLPEDMACVQGVKNFLPSQPFKNENIGVSEPAFSPSLFQDYILDKDWCLSQCCTYGMQQWITVKDTKVTNCPASNMIVNDLFCGIATSYSAVEVRRGLSKEYMRPWTITPNVLAFNCTGYNAIMNNKLYHAFDGISYRLVEWTGAPGMMKQLQTFWYAFQVNDRFKRSNKFPANELMGNFVSEPVQSLETIDKVWSQVTCGAKEKGLEAGTIGEDKDLVRWALPIFTEYVTTLPAAVRTLTVMPLAVVDGITGLVTDLYNSQTAYKAPLSVDFTIGKNAYRLTQEYICSVCTENGVDVTEDLVPALGLKYLGATPTEAYFYNKATRFYYVFSGNSLTKMDMFERFRDIKNGYWDFINQEVVMPCVMTFKRLNADIKDKDTETDNIIIPVLSRNQVSGELPPPITTIFNDRSWYKCYSLPSGFTYQGPNRVIINRQVFVEYMLSSLKSNLGKWNRLNREVYDTKRKYKDEYNRVNVDVEGIKGWTHNPFVLVTSALGQSESVDCMFEWVITFCWPIEMDLIYGQNNFAVVNVLAETMTPGGKVKSRPTHIYLTKELFSRSGNYGYYSFRFQSRNGAGNRERLHIWSDQYIAISSLVCESKIITNRRAEQLVQQLDIQNLKEL